MPVMAHGSEPDRGTGFTMIEVLITLVILMIGLLGIAGLMAQGQRASFEAYQRQQALALANDMAERIKANRPGVDTNVVAAPYDVAAAVVGTGAQFANLVAGAITNCATSNCNSAQLVTYDTAVWDGLLQGAAGETESATGAAVGPILQARGCIQRLAGAVCPAAGPPPSSVGVTYRVSVAWQGNYPTQAPTVLDARNTCGQGLYQFQNAVNDATRRMVSVDVYTVIAC